MGWRSERLMRQLLRCVARTASKKPSLGSVPNMAEHRCGRRRRRCSSWGRTVRIASHTCAVVVVVGDGGGGGGGGGGGWLSTPAMELPYLTSISRQVQESGRLLTIEESSTLTVYGNRVSIVIDNEIRVIFLMCEPSRCRASRRVVAASTATAGS